MILSRYDARLLPGDEDDARCPKCDAPLNYDKREQEVTCSQEGEDPNCDYSDGIDWDRVAEDRGQ